MKENRIKINMKKYIIMRKFLQEKREERRERIEQVMREREKQKVIERFIYYIYCI